MAGSKKRLKPVKRDVLSLVSINSARMLRSLVKSPLSIEGSADDGELRMEIESHCIPNNPSEDENQQLLVLVIYKAYIADDAGVKLGDTPFDISAIYEVLLEVRDRHVLSGSETEVLSDDVCIDITYPYWREFAATSLVRMDLGQLSLPPVSPVRTRKKRSTKGTN